MEIELGEIIVDEELEIGEIELDAVKIEPKTEQIEITPTKEEQIKEGLFDTVIVKGYGNREVRKFNSIEEMNSTIAVEGELATVYFKGFEPVQQDSKFRYVYFPKTVVLDESEKIVDISYSTPIGAYDETGKNIGGGSFTIYPAGGNFAIASMYGSKTILYSTTDGITFTRTDSYEEVVDGLTEFIFTSTLKPMLQRFAFIPVENYDGLYEYKEGSWNLIAPQGTINITKNGQYDVSDYAEANIDVKGIDTSDATATADKILEGQTAYVNNEKVTGTMPNNGIITITPSTEEQTLPKGYIEGGKVEAIIPSDGDPELEASFMSSIDDSLGANVTKFPNGFTSIRGYAFYDCTNLALSELPDDITKIGDRAFYNCTNLALSELPKEITAIGMYAFYKCSKITLNKLPSKITNISSYTFSGCTNLALTELPEGITEIYQYAFEDCTNLALTELPEGIHSIQTYAFDTCTNLALSKLPNNLSTLREYSFYHCSKITIRELPEKVTKINSGTFVGCIGITEMTCKGKVTSIGSSSFSGCTNLSKFALPNVTSVTTLSNKNAFTNTPIANGTGYIYVPDDLVDSFKTATNWSTYANQIKGISEMEG